MIVLLETLVKIKIDHSMKITSFSIPCFYKNTYSDTIEDYLLVYNPVSEKGMVVLNKEAGFLFSQIDGKKNLKDILSVVKKKDAKALFADIKKAFADFLSSEIIYFNKPESKTKLFSKKPRHLGVWLHITNQCNLRCTYCYIYKTQEKMSNNIANKAIGKIFQSAKKHNFKKITFKFSGGEPLLEFKRILKFVNKIKQWGKKLKVETDFVVLTNGVLLTEKVAQTLKENTVRAAVSIDGLGKYHNKTRIFVNGKPSFKQVEQGIKNLIKAKVLFNVSITITSKNIENIPDLTKYLLKRNIPFAFNFYRENPYVKEKLEGNDKKLVNYLKKAYKLIYQNPPRYSLINGLLDRVVSKKPHLYTCGMGNSYIVVRHNGEMASCQMTIEKSIGSIDDKDLIKTMQKGDFTKAITVEEKTPCKKCQWKYICCGGCPLLTLEQKGKCNVSSPYCVVYKTLIPEMLRIEAKRLIKYGSEVYKTQKQDIKSPFVL